MARSDSLRAYLDSLFAANDGAIPFERFMSEALTHPEFGFYTAHIRTVGGSRGDFATSPTIGKLLGKAIARWAVEEAAAHNRPLTDFTLIEVGAGEGTLMHEVLESFSWWKRRRLSAAIVEVSPILRLRQEEMLKRFRRSVAWHDSIEQALSAAGGQALVFSNELVDAFPVILLEGADEVLVEFDPEQGLREIRRPLAETRPDLVNDQFSALQSGWPGKQRVELHDSYRRWLGGWLPLLKTGSTLTIDYGGAAAEIYHKRPGGSLRAFYRHQRLTGAGIYRMFGRQDLTADVCFDDVRNWGEQHGLETNRYQTQADFIRELAAPKARERSRETEFLLASDGAGSAFKVLGQRTRATNLE